MGEVGTFMWRLRCLPSAASLPCESSSSSLYKIGFQAFGMIPSFREAYSGRVDRRVTGQRTCDYVQELGLVGRGSPCEGRW